jgi:hypothetical protein
VAVSSAPTAVTVRQTVTRLIDQGRSDGQIEDYLAARYGSAIVLDPATTGWSLLVWVLPVVVGAGAVVVVAVVVLRRRRDGEDPDADLRGGTVDPAVLEERRRFLTQSLADADAEYLAGDMSDADYLSLRQRDLARLHALGPATATVTDPDPAPVGAYVPAPAPAAPSVGSAPVAAVATLEAPAPPLSGPTSGEEGVRPRRRGRNRWFLLGAVVSFAAALIVAVPLFATHRLPGQTATGTVSLSPSQQLVQSLDQAAATENSGQIGLAAQLYQAILNAHPDNEAALAQLGWLEFQIGREGSSTTLMADARVKLDRAVALAPGDYAAHLYLGTLLLEQDGDAAGAAAQYRLFLAAGPPASVLSQAAPTLRSAFTEAGQAVPAGVPGG